MRKNEFFQKFIKKHENHLDTILEELEDNSRVKIKDNFRKFIDQRNTVRLSYYGGYPRKLKKN